MKKQKRLKPWAIGIFCVSDAHSCILTLLLGETIVLASKSPSSILVYNKLQTRHLLPLRKVLILSACSPQIFSWITALSEVLALGWGEGGSFHTHPLSKIDGRGSQFLLRARDVIVTIQLESLEGFSPPFVSHLIPYHAMVLCAYFLFLKMLFSHRLWPWFPFCPECSLSPVLHTTRFFASRWI